MKANGRSNGPDRRVEQNRRKVCEFTVRRILADARKAGELTAIQKDELAARLERWLTRSYYVDFLRSLRMEALFFEEYLEPSLPLSLPLAREHDEAHCRKYVLFAFCAFLGFFGPNFNWQEDSESRKLAYSLLLIFRKHANEEDPSRRKFALQKFITLLFDSREDWQAIPQQMAPQVPSQSRAIQEEHVPTLSEACVKFGTWEKRIAWMHKNGVLYKGKSLIIAYKKKPGSVVRTLLRVTERLNNET